MTDRMRCRLFFFGGFVLALGCAVFEHIGPWYRVGWIILGVAVMQQYLPDKQTPT